MTPNRGTIAKCDTQRGEKQGEEMALRSNANSKRSLDD